MRWRGNLHELALGIMLVRRMSWRREAPWLIIARVITALAQFCILVAFARFSSASAAGSFALGLALAAPVFMFADLGLRNLYLSRRPKAPFGQFARLRLVSALLAFGLCLIVSPVFAVPALFIVLIGAAKALDLQTDLLFGVLQEGRRARWVCVLTAVNAFTSVGLALLALVLWDAPVIALTGSLVGSALTLIAVLVVTRRSDVCRGLLREREAHASIASLLCSGFRVGAAMSFASVAVFLPQYVLGITGGRRDLLVFAVLAYGITAAQILVNGVAQALLVDLRVALDSEPNSTVVTRAIRIVRRLTLVAICAGAAAAGFAPLILPTLMGDEYTISLGESALLSISIALVPVLLVASTLLYALNLYTYLLAANVTSAILVGVAAIALVPSLGLSGALVAAAVGMLARALVMWWGVVRPPGESVRGAERRKQGRSATDSVGGRA